MTPQITSTAIIRKDGEYIVKAYVNGKRYAPGDYFTNDKDDANTTALKMIAAVPNTLPNNLEVMVEEFMISMFGERYGPPKPRCYHCGEECSGDTTESICIDGTKGEMPICDDPDFCPKNQG